MGQKGGRGLGEWCVACGTVATCTVKPIFTPVKNGSCIEISVS